MLIKNRQPGNLFIFLSCVGGFSDNMHSLWCYILEAVCIWKAPYNLLSLPTPRHIGRQFPSVLSSCSMGSRLGHKALNSLHLSREGEMGAQTCRRASTLRLDAPSLGPCLLRLLSVAASWCFCPFLPFFSPFSSGRNFWERILNCKGLHSHSFKLSLDHL